MIKDLIKKNRSVRGYDNSREVTIEELREMLTVRDFQRRVSTCSR